MAEGLKSANPGIVTELVVIKTSGDRDQIGDKSRFVAEIDGALLAGEIDMAVHSAKDVPAELAEELAIVSVPERAAPQDAYVGTASFFGEVPGGARIGTSSLRRRSQLLAMRPGLDIKELKGNVDTRLAKLAEGQLDGIVLAACGLKRLGRSESCFSFQCGELVPAAGQGSLVVEARRGDESAATLAGSICDSESLVRLTAERSFVAALDASCNTPVAAYAWNGRGGLNLEAYVGLPDGSTWLRDLVEGNSDAPSELGRELARRMVAAGAAEILAEAEVVAGGL